MTNVRNFDQGLKIKSIFDLVFFKYTYCYSLCFSKLACLLTNTYPYQSYYIKNYVFSISVVPNVILTPNLKQSMSVIWKKIMKYYLKMIKMQELRKSPKTKSDWTDYINASTVSFMCLEPRNSFGCMLKSIWTQKKSKDVQNAHL